MNTYLSKSSAYVKIATLGFLILLCMVALTLITIDENYGVIGGTILSILIIGTAIYFYANSLEQIIITKNELILKKKSGKIIILKSDIIEVHKLGCSNLTMTYGSKGVFGFIGNTMDDSVSFVKDRKNMLRITTKTKKYLISSERSDELVNEIKTRYNIE